MPSPRRDFDYTAATAEPAADAAAAVRAAAAMALSPQALGYAGADKRIEILQLVGAHGSISQAARVAGISYKAAWQAIHTLTNLAGEPLVAASVGGAGGGGARLTPAAERLLHAAGLLHEARRSVLARVNADAAPLVTGALNAPRTSMRNHLRCRITALRSDGARDPMVHVALGVEGGGALAALITRESAELLALAPGLPVLALAKATAVAVTPGCRSDGGGAGGAAENALVGRVTAKTRGATRDEIALALVGGQRLVGFAAHPNRLRSGSAVIAVLHESALVIALA